MKTTKAFYQILFYLFLSILVLGCPQPTGPNIDPVVDDPIIDDPTEPDPIYYNIIFISEDNILLEYPLLENEKISDIPTATKDGHNFIGWYVNDSLFDFNNNINSDLTLSAYFEEKVFHLVEFYDFGILQATYSVEHNTEFLITEHINYQQKVIFDEARTPFTTYWKLGDINYSINDSILVTEDCVFNIHRKLDDLYTPSSIEQVLLPWTEYCDYYNNDDQLLPEFKKGDIRFSPTYNHNTYSYYPMFQYFGNLSGQILSEGRLIVLVSTNSESSTIEEFLSGLVEPRTENYVATVENTIYHHINVKGLNITYDLQPGEYRVWLTSTTYEGLYYGQAATYPHTSKIVYTEETFSRNSYKIIVN